MVCFDHQSRNGAGGGWMLLGVDQSDSALWDEYSEDTPATLSCLDCDTDHIM